MEGIYHCTEAGENTTRHWLRFYPDGHVIYKAITGDSKDYIKAQLNGFIMVGLAIKRDPEYTFCGAYQDYGDSLSFKIENEISNPADSWVQKDLLSFRGKIVNGTELHLAQSSKRTQKTVDRIFTKTTEEEILAGL